LDNLFALFFFGACLLLPFAAGIIAPFGVALFVAALFFLMSWRISGSPGIVPFLSGWATIVIACVMHVVRNWAGILQWLTEHTT
jgi:hypothetical protein